MSEKLSINTIAIMIFSGLVLMCIATYIIGYHDGRRDESILNLNQRVFIEGGQDGLQ